MNEYHEYQLRRRAIRLILQLQIWYSMPPYGCDYGGTDD
jgi:hypothetical protein